MSEMTLTTDHPAWETLRAGHVARLVKTSSGAWFADWGYQGLRLTCIEGTEDSKPFVSKTSAADLPERIPLALGAGLARLGGVSRLANPWLWDALTTAILRQVVRAAQARVLYQRWCQAYGTALTRPEGHLALAPAPEIVLALPGGAFSAVGAAFHHTALHAAAAAYLADGAAWAALAGAELVRALGKIPRIGPWTARAAAADFSGDFSVYPHGDLAVRTWARRAAPGIAWPEKDRAFEAMWRAFADTPQQLHALTLLTLTWGSHARIDPDRSASN
jgi:DNA-3-methyladenine glycosylase II